MEQNDRQKRIMRTSLLGVLINLAFAAVKIIIGAAASSLAIISEGMNNATDAGSSLLTLIGTRLSAKHPDRKHPFGYGRIEYLTGLVVSALILYTGVELLKSSVEGVLHPEEPSVSILMLGIVAGTAVGKLILGLYTIRVGKKENSASLIAVGQEGRNDSIFSVVTIGVSVLYLCTGLSLDAWAGILFALVILKSGLGTLKETVDELLGRPGQEELAKQLYKEFRSEPMVVNAADLMLHNYGPDEWHGSANLELDHALTVEEVYRVIHALQLRVMKKYRVTMVFGIYAVNQSYEGMRELRKTFVDFIRKTEHVKSLHALYLEPGTGTIYCDLVVDYELRDWEGMRRDLLKELEEHYPGHAVELTIETEYI